MPQSANEAVITGLGVAVPRQLDHQRLWAEVFAERYADQPSAGRIWTSAGVRTRHAVVDPRVEDVSLWPTSTRMERFAVEVAPLGATAVRLALADAGLEPEDVGLFVVTTCTGFGAPGPDVTLARDLGFAPNVRRLAVTGMGCYAALPSLASAADFVRAQGRPAVVLCAELTSLHLQPPEGDDLEQLVAHALFADAAAAVVLQPGGPGERVMDLATAVAPDTTGEMTWDMTETGFRMRLSAGVPDVLAEQVGPLVKSLLHEHGLVPDDIAAWVVHPGGPAILDAVVASLGLAPDVVDVSRDVLADNGNCSSPTVLMVLDRFRRTRPLAPGEYGLALTMGPGLTVYAALLQRR